MTRSLLGAADVSDGDLAGMVAAQVGAPPEVVEILTSDVEPVAYDIPAITTCGRYWVTVQARVADEVQSVRFFVKHVQAWSRHPFFAQVPPEQREMAAAEVPWRTEPLVYRSDLGERLPAGLRMPRALGVFDLDAESAAIWLEEVPAREVPWDLGRFARAALLLGRLAASPEVAPLAGVGRFDWDVRRYVHGRVAIQILPILRNETTWQHPLAAAFVGDLRDRVLAAADRAVGYGEELAALPLLTGHGDAAPNNLMPGAADDDFVLIDYGFWNRLPVAFDLGQLLVGDVQLGRRPADVLEETERAIVSAYVEGLRAEGCEIPEATVRRAHALQLLLWTGLSTLPFEHFGSPPTAELHQLASDRAAIARFSLDLVDATEG